MSELTLLILRLAFLLVLWGFVFAVVYALRTDLFGQRVKRMPAADASAPGQLPIAAFPQPTQQPAPVGVAANTSSASAAAAAAAMTVRVQRPRSPANSLPNNSSPPASPTTASKLVITSGTKAGLELPLGGQPLTIGRSAESGLVIRDDYTSTHHARLMLMDGSWVIHDLDSTNGTFLDGVRVHLPTRIPLNTPVRIGTTTFELKR